MALISCKDLVLGYGGVEIVSNINFEINQGDYLCIVGQNGSGKSTLVRTLLSLQEPMGGNIEFNDGLLKKEIGYLPQQGPIQRDFPSSVWEIVLSGNQGHKGLSPFYDKKDKELALSNIRKMGIEDLKDCCYRKLSGGQQQRVLLARALCASSKVLLLDEPVAGLDVKITNEMYKIIDDLNKKEGVTIIMISHDLQMAKQYASHILHISKKVFFGTKQEYLNSETGKKFMGVDR